jgi:hypothetical protein
MQLEIPRMLSELLFTMKRGTLKLLDIITEISFSILAIYRITRIQRLHVALHRDITEHNSRIGDIYGEEGT